MLRQPKQVIQVEFDKDISEISTAGDCKCKKVSEKLKTIYGLLKLKGKRISGLPCSILQSETILPFFHFRKMKVILKRFSDISPMDE